MVKDHSDSEGGNPLPPHGLLFPISSKGSFVCIIPQVSFSQCVCGARCSSVVRVDPLSESRSSQCSMTGVTKAVVCVILSVGWCI